MTTKPRTKVLAALLAAALLAPAPLLRADPPDVGDVNGDGIVNVADVFYLINNLFAGAPAPLGSGDANGDGAVDAIDVFYLINFLFAQGPPPVFGGWLSAWPSFGHDPSHMGRSTAKAQSLTRVRWQTPVDLAPQLVEGELLAHYGSPLVTRAGNVVIPVKTGATDGFRTEARNPATGALLWSLDSDYTVPAHQWFPVFQPTITPQGAAVMPAAGGTLLRRASGDSESSTVERLAFYGLAAYQAAPSAFSSTVRVNTPITSDANGNLYFGFEVTGANPANLTSGIARVAANGTGIWTPVTTAAGDGSVTKVVMNCAPALSLDGSRLYVLVRSGGPNSGTGFFVALDTTTLARVASVVPLDPFTKMPAAMSDNGTASPTVGPDGDVYIGVLENGASHHGRGWLLHYDATLATSKPAGSFGWDSTPVVVPAASVPSYDGGWPYLLFIKYNDYAGTGGTGVNKLAVLDPSQTQADPIVGIAVMKEILTIANPTHDDEYPDIPTAVREWCINIGVVDPARKSIYGNAEDGFLYRWDLPTNTFAEKIALTGGQFEAYTPTLIGRDGTVYAIQGGVLFAVGD
jgi:hypothetical protein